MTQLFIETQSLTKLYHQHPAVDHLSLSVPKGSIYGFLGPNGAGKSTTMKMLLGLIHPDGGRIRIDGMEMNEKNRTAILSRTGSLIESPSYYGNLTARENLRISCLLRKLPESEIDRVLKLVRLDGQEKKLASHFSLGMKQRLGLANALLGSPELVLLDEPTNGLDPAGIHEMRELIKNLPKAWGMTVLISSHLLAEIQQTADCIGILSRGKLVFQGPLKTLQERNRTSLLLRTSSPETAAAFLSRQLKETVALTSRGLRLPCLPDGRLAALLRGLMEQGIELYRVEEQSGNLEDLYLELVKEGGL